MNCCLAKDRKKVFLPGDHMTKRLYQLRARFEDGLKICRAQAEEETGAEGRESFTRRRTSQKRYFTEGVAGTYPPQFEFSRVLSPVRDLNNAVENELD